MRTKPSEAGKRIDDIERRVGRNLRRLRMERAVSQAALADHLGVVHQVVGRFELGVVRVAAGYLPGIAAALGIAVDDLFADDQDAHPITVTAQRLAPFMRDVMVIAGDEQLDALNAVAKALAEASGALGAALHQVAELSAAAGNLPPKA
ncbi:helix-turn-helix transcriptional regulator [Roseomonas stagni]|uniref:Helix-turn-helix transcriptional regulator n=1 Tax=Falsiroseomonas algicola TaxID=2716930 RepID=A0A6M1LK90_9PROT|nr:helix-turn-helix transcriptional regulator [Falsiroseomonas algicola]NGM20711.1 helix-turn-helix transcriptional regulator [Falsiroseomonas algicola]